jgi:hypothetical protein
LFMGAGPGNNKPGFSRRPNMIFLFCYSLPEAPWLCYRWLIPVSPGRSLHPHHPDIDEVAVIPSGSEEIAPSGSKTHKWFLVICFVNATVTP